MTQPPGQPPQGGFGPPPSGGPQGYGPSTASGATDPYDRQAGQAPVGGGYNAPGPYGGQGPYDAYPPPHGGQEGGSNGRIVAIVTAAVAVTTLVCGGVYLALSGDDEGRDPVAGPSSEATATTEGRPDGDPTDDPLPTSDPTGHEDPVSDPTDVGADPAEDPPSAGDFEGSWQDEKARTLTVGAEHSTGEAAGKHRVSYIDFHDSDKGLCVGLGDERGSGFRIAVKCGTGEDEKYFSASVTKTGTGDGLTLTWDEGGSETLDWAGR